MDKSKEAKETFVHYFSLLAKRQGIQWDSDNVAEIEMAVDYLIEAAAELAAKNAKREANNQAAIREASRYEF